MKRVVLESITARLLWDGRVEDGRFIPGIAHFQAGARALRRAADAGDDHARERLREIDETLGKAEQAVNRWAKGLAAFARDTLGDPPPTPAWEDVERRALRVRTPEAERLAELVGAFDVACAATSAVTARARGRGVFNPHHGSIAERARMIRRIADLGHAGGLACRRSRATAPVASGAAKGFGLRAQDGNLPRGRILPPVSATGSQVRPRTA